MGGRGVEEEKGKAYSFISRGGAHRTDLTKRDSEREKENGLGFVYSRCRYIMYNITKEEKGGGLGES